MRVLCDVDNPLMQRLCALDFWDDPDEEDDYMLSSENPARIKCFKYERGRSQLVSSLWAPIERGIVLPPGHRMRTKNSLRPTAAPIAPGTSFHILPGAYSLI